LSLTAKNEKLKDLGPDARPVPELIKEAEQQIETVRRDVLMTQSAELMYRNFIDRAHENHECPLCERGFADSGLKDFVGKVRSEPCGYRGLIWD
jgi:hypothetical protein